MESGEGTEGTEPAVTRGKEYLRQTEKLYNAEGIYNVKLAKAERKRRKKAGKSLKDSAMNEEEGSDYDFNVDFKGKKEVEEESGEEEEEDEEEEEEGSEDAMEES